MSKAGVLRTALAIVAVLLVQGTWALAGTTGSIAGKVTDQNGNNVAAVRVTASSPSQSQSSTTGSNGFYSMLGLSPDTYSVTGSKDGYDTSTVYGITVTADQVTNADFKLHATVKTIGHITTTATASVVSKTVTGDLYAVNGQAINNYQGSQGGAETLYSQNGVVGSLPGVVRQVGSGAGYNGQGTLSLRGGSFDQVGYELDGVPLNRGFDFYNGTTFMTNGLASLQVYTGGAPADAGRAMSGYINEVIQRGKYPGGADFTGVMGSPLFNHTMQADIYGGTPDDHFTYYVSTLATNSFNNFGNRSNLANTSYTVPANDPGCGQFNKTGSVAAGGPPLNCSVANSLNTPVSLGAYGSFPFSAARDTATNLHWSFGHGALNDDLQALYVVGTGLQAPYGQYGVSTADPFQVSEIQGEIGPGGTLIWPVGSFYRGFAGQPYNAALNETLTWPTSYGSVGGPIPPTYTDSNSQQYSIEKLAYTRALTQNSFLRILGYQMYSAWNIDQAINFFVGGTFYQLHDNASGTGFDYENQLNQQNLLKFEGDWSRDLTLRYNYANYPALASGPLTCAAGGAAAPCGPGTMVTSVPAPFSTFNNVNPIDWDGVLSDAFKPNDRLLFNLGLRYDIFGYQLMPMTINGANGIAHLAETQDGICLNGFNYSPSDPKTIGPGGNENCFGLLPTTGRDAPGAFNWQDAPPSLYFRTLSPRFGLTFTTDPRDVIRFSVGRYVQGPNSAFEQYRAAPQWGLAQTVGLLNSFYDGLGFGVVHYIQPEDSTNYDLSFEHEFDGGLSVKLTPYYRNTRNQVLTIPFDPQMPSFVTGDNFGAAHIRGAEFLLAKNVTGQTGIGGTLSATYTDSKIRFEKVNGTSFIDVQNGLDAAGQCTGTGICGYNRAYNTNYPLLDPSGYYSPSFVQSPTAYTPSYDVRLVINLTLDARTAGFDFLPTLNYQSGNPYGDPLQFPDPHCAAAATPGCIPVPTGINPRTGVAYAYYGGNGPDPYTGTFDGPGSLKGPSWWSLNLAIAHDIGHNLKATILGTNLVAGVHNQGYPWEFPTSQQNISYTDNGFYSALPLGLGATGTKYYGSNYYPYDPAGTLPYRDWVFSVSAKL